MRLNRIAIAAGLLALLAAAGCQSGPAKPTPKEEATKKWNAARAAVLAGLARDQFQSGNFDKARQTVDEALRMVPDHAPLHVLSAKLLIEKGQLEAAERELEAARKFAPNDAEAFYLSGVVYQRWQRPQDAYNNYAAAAERSPADLPYVLAQAEMLVAMDRMPEALALLQGKVTYFEHSGAIRDAVGQLLMQVGKYADAVAVLRQASILSEKDDSVRERLALALYFNKDYREAGDLLERLTQSEAYNKRADLFLVLGECFLQTARPREARVTFETATQLDPQSAQGWRGLGRAALEAGDLKRAELALARSLKVDGGLAETHLLLGYVRVKQDRLPEAQTAFERASALDPHDTVSLCMIGYVLEKQGRSDAAAQAYAKALRIKPGDDMASRLMAGVDLNE